jgi:hypothetical protein
LALGYRSWRQYVRVEFGLSRSRSYELLDQAQVLRAIQNAIGLPAVPNIPANMAVRIKPHLSQIIESVKLRTAEVPPDQLADAVTNVIRLELRAGRSDQTAHGGLAQLALAVERLATMPPVAEIVAQLPDGPGDDALSRLPAAHRWLNEFALAWRRQQHVLLAAHLGADHTAR